MARAKRQRDSDGSVVRLEQNRAKVRRNAPATGYNQMGPSDHFVQFYETDSFLLNSLTGFFGTGLDIGDACIVVADHEHRERLENSLRASGRDVERARDAEQYLAVDDEELLSRFMVDGWPDAANFYDSVGRLIERASAGGRRVRIFGEMVAKLWSRQNHSGAIRLEELWNELSAKYPFALYCAYPLRAFDAENHGEPLFHICSGHTRVIPGESYTALYEAEDRLRAIVLLQQKAARLEAEVAERKNALIRERLARADAENASRLKDQFLSTVSHELRTPLNVIIGWATMFRAGKLDEAAQKRAIETIENNARQQSKLIDDILDMSRAISGQTKMNITDVDLISVIGEAVKSIRHAAEVKEITVDFEPSGLSIPLLGDGERLRQIFWNILSNAVKFTDHGGLVTVDKRFNDGMVEVIVADNGRGISADFLPFIFDHFRQADGSRTRQKGGLGLGLSIVRHLVELHGGTISASSAGEGKGAAFTVRLPLKN